MSALLNWRVFPAARVTIGLAAGILMADACGVDPSFIQYGLMVSWGLGCVFHLGNRSPGVIPLGWIIWTILILSGAWLAYIGFRVNDSVNPNLPSGKWEQSIIRDITPGPRGTCRIACSLEGIPDGPESNGPYRNLFYLRQDSLCGLMPGDTLSIKGRFIPIMVNGMHGESFQQYLLGKGIRARCYPDSLKVKRYTGRYPLSIRLSHGVRRRMAKRFRSLVPGSEGELLSSLCLGYRVLDTDIKQQFQVAGAMHILAISGLHIGIAAAVIRWPLERLLPGHLPGARLSVRLLTQVAVWTFVTLSGSAESAVRAAIMISVWDWGKAIDRDTHWVQLLSLSALIQIILDPCVLFDVGFQLSYFALTFILWLSPWIQLTSRWVPKYLKWPVSLALVSSAAQLGVAGLSLYHFQHFPVYFLLSNLIAIPAATLFLIGGWVLVINDLLWPDLASCWSPLLEWLISHFLTMVRAIAALPALIRPMELDLFNTSLYYFGMITMVAWMYFRRSGLLILSAAFLAWTWVSVMQIQVHRYSGTSLTYWHTHGIPHLLVQLKDRAWHFSADTALNNAPFHVRKQWDYHHPSSIEFIKKGKLEWKAPNKDRALVLAGQSASEPLAQKISFVLLLNSPLPPGETAQDQWCSCEQIILTEETQHLRALIDQICKDAPPISILKSGEHRCLTLKTL